MTTADIITIPAKVASAVIGVLYPKQEGALVRLADGRVGFIQIIRQSTYVGEACNRAYVYSSEWDTGARWASWELLDDLTVIG